MQNTTLLEFFPPPPKPQIISISNRSLDLGLRSFSAHRNWTYSSSIGKSFPHPPIHTPTKTPTFSFFNCREKPPADCFFFSNWRKLWSLELWKNGTTQLSSTVSESSISQLLQHTSRTLTNITHTKEESATKKQQFGSTSQHFQRRERERERERENTKTWSFFSIFEPKIVIYAFINKLEFIVALQQQQQQ